MPTSPKPITWWDLGKGCPAFRHTCSEPTVVHVIGMEGGTVLRVSVAANGILYLPIFELTSRGGTTHNQIMFRLGALLDATKGEGNFYGLVQAYSKIKQGRSAEIEMVHLGLVISENELQPYFDTTVWEVIPNDECERKGLPIFCQRPTRFEREEVI